MLNILPPPFEWIEIPTGKVTLIPNHTDKTYGYLKQKETFEIPAFAIAKYPITHGQYAKFIEAGGYREPRWWTKAGWQANQQGYVWDSTRLYDDTTGTPWTEPEYWQDAAYNTADNVPVIGVSWYEAVAFCTWLQALTGHSITLPTEQQWQRAAQGDDERPFPWGSEWDPKRCNTEVYNYGGQKLTPVQQYEGLGDSPFGVVDMIGNAVEWCLTAMSGSTNHEGKSYRAQRGGSKTTTHEWDDPGARITGYLGFRIARPI